MLTYVLSCVLTCVDPLQVGDRISDEARRAIYPELLKRLDDSSNKVGAGSGAWVEGCGDEVLGAACARTQHLTWCTAENLLNQCAFVATAGAGGCLRCSGGVCGFGGQQLLRHQQRVPCGWCGAAHGRQRRSSGRRCLPGASAGGWTG